jgi:delta-aminolevulinic acid dehydratase/porphobilinogen synthase
MFKCKWATCTQNFTVYDQLVDHVNEHITGAVPVMVSSLPTGKEKLTEKPQIPNEKEVMSARPLNINKSSSEEVDLMSATSGEDENEEDDDIVCEICGSGKEYTKNLIVLCDSCDSGFHQKCHPSVISDDLLKNDETLWVCYLCKPAEASGAK